MSDQIKLWILWTAVVVVIWPAGVWAEEAEEDEEDQPLAATVTVADGDLEIPRPTGWNAVRPGEGAVAVFRAATDETAQIEVRMSDSVSEVRWERYWRAFDNDLQQSGFEIYQGRTRRAYAGQQGMWYEYELVRPDQTYRLVVWHTHEGERAWVFSAFFTELRRPTYLQTFEELLEGLQW